jgi:FkbM family methyltransferase
MIFISILILFKEYIIRKNIMLISGDIISELLNKYNIIIKGVLHIGAHECEEKTFYNNYLKLNDESIIWIDANEEKVNDMKIKGYNNIYHSVLDEIERNIVFNITDNSQASSILVLNHENGFYNNINIIKQIECKTEKLSSFLNRINKNPKYYNFWNLDIQGTELNVIKGSNELLESCDAIYTEVNSDYVYKNCSLINDIDDFLKQYNFKRVYTLWTDVKWGDALYLKTK